MDVRELSTLIKESESTFANGLIRESVHVDFLSLCYGLIHSIAFSSLTKVSAKESNSQYGRKMRHNRTVDRKRRHNLRDSPQLDTDNLKYSRFGAKFQLKSINQIELDNLEDSQSSSRSIQSLMSSKSLTSSQPQMSSSSTYGSQALNFIQSVLPGSQGERKHQDKKRRKQQQRRSRYKSKNLDSHPRYSPFIVRDIGNTSPVDKGALGKLEEPKEIVRTLTLGFFKVCLKRSTKLGSIEVNTVSNHLDKAVKVLNQAKILAYKGIEHFLYTALNSAPTIQPSGPSITPITPLDPLDLILNKQHGRTIVSGLLSFILRGSDSFQRIGVQPQEPSSASSQGHWN